MERKISEWKRKFLDSESRCWVEEGLISSEQRHAILDGYSVSRNLPAVVLILGVLMIGIGTISLVAANWQYLGVWLKAFLIVGMYVLTIGGAYAADRRRAEAVADSLMFLSGFVLAGGLAMMSQLFHIAWRIETLLGIWLTVFLPTFALVRHIAVYTLYEIVALAYMNHLYFTIAEALGSRPGFDSARFFLPVQPLLLMVLLAGTAWHHWWETRRLDALEARAPALKRFLFGGSTRRIFLSNFYLINWFVWMCILNSTGRTMVPFFMGILLIGAVISVMAWKLEHSSDLDLQGLLCIGIGGIALTFPAVWEGRWYYRYGADSGSPEILALATSLLLGAWLVYRIARRGGGVAVFVFCALLMRWYFDMFYSYMSKSLFFITGGLILLGTAWGYRRWTKKHAGDAIPPVFEDSGGGADDAHPGS